MSKINLQAILKGGVEDNNDDDAGTGTGEGSEVVDAENFEPMTEEEQIAQEEADAIAEELPADEAQIDEDTADLDRLVESSDGLESLAVSLQQAIDDGGLSPTAAQFAVHSMEAYFKPLGEDTGVSSLESFGGFTSRLTASQEALERVKATLKKIWEAIKALAKRVWNWIKEFFRKIFTAVGRLETAVARLKKRLENHDGSFASKIEGGKLAKIAVGNTVSANNIKTMVAVAEECFTFDEASTKYINNMYSMIKEFASKPLPASATNVASAVAKKNTSEKRQVPTSFKANNAANGDKNELTYSTAVLPGNVRFHLRRRKPSEGSVADVVAAVFGPWRFEKETDDKAAKSMPSAINAFSAADIKTVISGTESIIEMSKRIKTNEEAAAVTIKEFEIANDVPAEQAAAVRMMLNEYGKQVTQARQMSAKVLAYAVSSCHSFIAVSHRSLKGKKAD